MYPGRRIVVFLLPLIFLCHGHAQQLSEPVASYAMDVVLDTDQRRLHAGTVLTWVNPSADTIRELHFHMYLNAFKNTLSTWMKEDQFYMEIQGREWYETCGWGWIDINAMYDSEGNPLHDGFTFIHPDDENVQDQTVLRIPLVTPVLPYDTTVFTYDWSAQIPHAAIRTGYASDFYFLAQWFPKIGVYEPVGMRGAETGRWNCHQYHVNSEYYADFGVYDVRITVPDDFVVGASGVLMDKTSSTTGTKWRFRAEDVIDFAWSASPHFMVFGDQWQDVSIALLIYPEHAQYAHRFFEAIKHTLTFLDEKIGDYPYPNITIIAPPIHGFFAGAMEYPTLITAFATAFLPAKFRGTETLVVHECIHQYFMQMVATNEAEEPWMDEGITSYFEAVIMDRYYGPQTSVLDWCGVHIGNLEYTRHEYLASPYGSHYAGDLVSWAYHMAAYSAIAYSKATIWLKTLEGLVGSDVMDESMRTYFERWKFRHPCAQDFIDIVNETVLKRLHDRFPDGMDWYFDQVLRGTEVCDFAVGEIVFLEDEPLSGFIDENAGCVTLPRDAAPMPQTGIARTTLIRKGDMILPVGVRITFDDGTVVSDVWDGFAKAKELSYPGTKRIVSVEIDPERLILLDQNFINNSRTAEIQRPALKSRFVRWLCGLQHFMESISLLM